MSEHIYAIRERQEIPYGYCQCGCGQLTPIAKKTLHSKEWTKGQPKRFIHGHNRRIPDLAPPGFKTCNKCQEVKPLAGFHRTKSGPSAGQYHARCSECKRASGRSYHHANRDKQLARIAEYQRRNKEKLSAAERARRADPAYRERCARELKEWRERNREHVAAYNRSQQVKARTAVNKAVLRGELPHVTTLTCSRCEEDQAKQYHHYAGYERENWYKVIPVCTTCHGREHWVSA